MLLLCLKLLGVVVVDDLEGLAAVGKVARVDADLLKGLGHQHRDRRLEVNVGHQGDIVSARSTQRIDLGFRV